MNKDLKTEPDALSLYLNYLLFFLLLGAFG